MNILKAQCVTLFFALLVTETDAERNYYTCRVASFPKPLSETAY